MNLLTKSKRNPFLISGLGILTGKLNLETIIMQRISLFIRHIGRLRFAFLLLSGVVYGQQAIWDRSGVEFDSHYGYYVFALGDQNDDGYADWGVGSFAGRADEPNASLVELFHGGDPPNEEPYMVFRADPEIYYDLTLSAGIDDVNGDNYLDWTIYFRQLDNLQVRVCDVYLGGPDSDTLPDIAFILRGGLFGEYLIGIKDFNGDQFDDLYVRDRLNDLGYVCWGSVNLDTVPDWFLHSPPDQPNLSAPLASGDLNGDGYSDFFGGNNNESMKVFWGSENPDTIPGQYVMGAGGSAEAIVQDLNGDGVSDLVAASQSTIKVHFGRDSIHAAPDGLCTFPGVAYSAHSLGDINDDGHGDFGIVDIGIGSSGRLSVYLGYRWINPNPFLSFSDYAEPLELVNIWTCAGLGDVNGDGVDDFIIGAQGGDTEGRRGRAVVIAGSRNWIVPAEEYIIPFPKNFEVSAFPNPFNSTTTLRLNLPIGTRNVSLSVCNVMGQMVEKVEVQVSAPQVDVQLAADNWSSGIYFAMAEAMGTQETIKLVLLK